MSDPEVENDYDRQLDRLVDTQGISYTDAREQLGLNTIAARPAYPRLSRRGGRAFPVPSDSELDPNWNVSYLPLSAEQKEINRRGIALARKMGELVMSQEYLALNESSREAAKQALIDRHNSQQ